MRSLGKVSCIIPNHRRDISSLLRSIRTSSYKDTEIIVVDEGLERSKQRNIGIDRSTGDYLFFIDSDMRLSKNLIEECMVKIQLCNGIYPREVITTKGFFGRLRNWERQFYNGTAIDCVRFVRKKDCPYFDENMNGPEDSDWDRRIPEPKLVTHNAYYHQDAVTLKSYLAKKAYYAKSMKRFEERNPNDKVLNLWWRCFLVFWEDGKWVRFISRPHYAISVLFVIFLRGIIYQWAKHSS